KNQYDREPVGPIYAQSGNFGEDPYRSRVFELRGFVFSGSFFRRSIGRGALRGWSFTSVRFHSLRKCKCREQQCRKQNSRLPEFGVASHRPPTCAIAGSKTERMISVARRPAS